MEGQSERAGGGGWTRARLLRGALGGGALIAGGVAIGTRTGGTLLAAPSKETDDRILRVLLLLERVQEDFYVAAVEQARLEGDLMRYAQIVGRQEGDHVALLTERLRGSAPPPPEPDFGDALTDSARFRGVAIELEESTLAVYIGQAANLTVPTMVAIAPLISVEARQAAWLRDLAGVSPAPRAADPARKPEDVVSELRERGFI